MRVPSTWSFFVVVTLAMLCTLAVSSDSAVMKRRPYMDSISDRELCSILCSRDEWCPLSCPNHALVGANFGKRNYIPFNDALGNLSFDDYLFLKMMGRTRK